MKRIQLGNTVFEGENDVYLFDDGETTALVDTCVALPEVREEFEAGLAEYGVEMADIDAVLLTHWHPDHSGLAGEVQAESDAHVFAHEADAPLVNGSETPFTEDPAEQHRVFGEWGLPDAKREGLMRFFENVSADLAGPPADVTTVSDGDRIVLGDAELEPVHLPGHTAGLVAYEFDPRNFPNHEPVGGDSGGEPREAFTGDALLPRYTPNVGGADTRVESPLAAYADSLARMVGRNWDAAHPGHRERIDDPSRRAALILDHHRHRTRKVVEVLGEVDEGLTPWEVSAELFGELSEIHVLHGPGEAYAHLDHLADAGVVACDPGTGTHGGDAYRLVEPDADLDALFPETAFDDVVDGRDA